MNTKMRTAVMGWAMLAIAGASQAFAEHSVTLAVPLERVVKEKFVNMTPLQCTWDSSPYGDPEFKGAFGNARFPLGRAIYEDLRFQHQTATSPTCDWYQVAELKRIGAETYHHLFARVSVELKRRSAPIANSYGRCRTWLEETVQVTFDSRSAYGAPLIMTSVATGDSSNQACD